MTKERVEGMFAELVVKIFNIEKILALPLCAKLAFHVNLDEEDFIERRRRVEFFAVADDVVALMKKVGEFVLFEGLEFGD